MATGGLICRFLEQTAEARGDFVHARAHGLAGVLAEPMLAAALPTALMVPLTTSLKTCLVKSAGVMPSGPLPKSVR